MKYLLFGCDLFPQTPAAPHLQAYDFMWLNQIRRRATALLQTARFIKRSIRLGRLSEVFKETRRHYTQTLLVVTFRKMKLPIIPLVVAVTLLSAVLYLFTATRPDHRTLDVPRLTRLADIDGIETEAAIAPDGIRLAVIVSGDLWILDTSTG